MSFNCCLSAFGLSSHLLGYLCRDQLYPRDCKSSILSKLLNCLVSLVFSTTYPKERVFKEVHHKEVYEVPPFADSLVCAILMQISMKDMTSGTQTMIDHQKF